MEEFTKNVLELRKRLEDKFEEKFGPKNHVTIEANTLDELYFKIIDAALKYGRIYKISAGSFSGSHRLEFDSASLIVTNPNTRPLAPIPRTGIPVTTNDDKIEQYFLKYLLDGSLESNEEYKYSSWIGGIPPSLPLEHKGVPRGTRLNQLEWCINHFIKHGFENNHCYITVGCAEGLQRYDWEYETDAEKGSTECLRGISFKIKDGKLNITVFFRSWDAIAGTPENLGGFVRLSEYVVDEINSKIKKIKDIPYLPINFKKELQTNYPEVKIGNLCAHSDGLHVYEHNLDLAKLWVGLDK